MTFFLLDGYSGSFMYMEWFQLAAQLGIRDINGTKLAGFDMEVFLLVMVTSI